MRESINILGKKDRRSRYKALLLLKKTIDRGTFELLKRGLELEIEGFEQKAFAIYLTSIVRKSSVELLIINYKSLAKATPPQETLSPDTLESFADAFKEILVFECRLIDMIFKKVQLQRWQTNKKLDIDSLKTEVFNYLDDIAGDALLAYTEFRSLIGLKTEASHEMEVETFFWRRLGEYEKMGIWFDSQNPKGTLLWEASKNIASAMVGGPSFLLMGVIMETVSNQSETDEDFITCFFDIPHRKIDQMKKE